MSQKSSEVVNQLLAELEGVTDEKSIKKFVVEAWVKLEELVTNKNTFRKIRSDLRKALESAFPNSETPKPGYYFTSQGKNKGERYEHLSLWYATTNKDRWSVVGNKAREKYFAELPELPTKEENKTAPQDNSELESQPLLKLEPQPQSKPQSQKRTQAKKLTLKDMTLQNLELDSETQEIVQNALNHSGMSLADFIKQACKVYAKTIVGKAKQSDIDLVSIPTLELLENPTYRTLPGRVEELTNRAIQAIMHHNDISTEKSQKWCITASAINALTGCKMELIKKVTEQTKIAIEDHNRKHQFVTKKGEIDVYQNRKKESIQDDIDFKNFSTDQTQFTKVTTQPKIEPTPQATPVKNKGEKTEIIILPVRASTIEIHEKLKANPNYKVRTREGRKALTHVLVEDGTKVLTEETGEVEPLVV